MAEAGWAAVVVNYNAGPHLAECVRTLVADDSGGPVDIVVVDNGSEDDSLARVEALDAPLGGTTIRVVRTERNLGYARAANLGVAGTTAPIVAIFNPDIVVRAGTAGAMLHALAAEPRAGAVGPRIVDAQGRHYASAREVPSLATSAGHVLLSVVAPRNRWTRRYRQEDIDPHAARATDWISGAARWLRRDALDDVGGLDERFFMFFEDVDLGARLREHGWTVLYEPAGEVMHIEGVSRRRHPVWMLVEHHQAAYRYASLHWKGAKRALLPVAAVVLTARAAALLVVAQVKRVWSRG